MKYYVLNYRYKRHKNVINYGDNLQSIAVKHLLSKFGIIEDKIGYIVRDVMGLRDNQREPGIFIPATGGLSWNSYPGSSDLPVNDHNLSILYFGIRVPEGSYDVMRHSEQFIASLKKYEPIGCRDAATRDFIRSLGIKAFFSKCVTLSFDNRPSHIKGKNIYIFKEDESEEYKKVIPHHIWKGHKELPIILDAPNPAPMTDKDSFLVNKHAIERLNFLKRDAKLVISSRIHVAIPCAALGIPVIFVDRYPNDSRTSIARYLLPATSIQDLKNIDLEKVKPADFSMHKEKMRLLFGYCLEKAEKIIGTGNTYLNKNEQSKARQLLEQLCEEEEPRNTYKPQSFATERLISVLFGKRLQDILKLNRPIVLFGAGEFGGRIKTILNRAGLYPVCYADNAMANNEMAWAHSLRVISFDELSENHRNSHIVISIPGRQNEVMEQLLKHNFSKKLIIDTTEFCREYIEYIPPLA